MITIVTKADRIEPIIDEIAQRLLIELESASSMDLSDVNYAKKILRLADITYAKMMLQQIGNRTKQSVGTESEIEKRAVIKVLLFSTWLQRFYFIIRSFLMGLTSFAVTYLIIWFLGLVNAVESIVIGLFVFVFSLVVTRVFDTQIMQISKKIVEIMASHRAIRDFIMKHF